MKKLETGDVSDIIAKLVSPKTQITAPVFFSNLGGPDSAITDTSAHAFHLPRMLWLCKLLADDKQAALSS